MEPFSRDALPQGFKDEMLRNQVIIVAGPTASGKSALAMQLAERLAAGRAVIINADSMQMYRDLRIVTARPGPDDEARVPHRLYGVLDADDPCSAARYRDLALPEIAAARQAERRPILAGGTGLYIRALTRGLSPVPDIPSDIRAAVRRLHRRLGSDGFHRALRERDPDMADRLHAGDTQRCLRAFEVIEATGRSLADWQAMPSEGPVLDGPIVTIALTPPRDWLYDRCDRRFDAMLAAGALDEIRALAAKGYDPGLPAMKALGVPELLRHVRGDCSLDDAVTAAKTATRRYAKRQLTWFRHQMDEATVIESVDAQERLDHAVAAVEGKIQAGSAVPQ